MHADSTESSLGFLAPLRLVGFVVGLVGFGRLVENEVVVVSKQLTLQRFAWIVTTHVFCWTVLDAEVALLMTIRNVEETDVQVSCAFARTAGAILLQMDGTGIVLVDGSLALIPLIHQKQSCPQCWRHAVICSHQFSLSRTPGVQLLFAGDASRK